jgi:hypothetical protein
MMNDPMLANDKQNVQAILNGIKEKHTCALQRLCWQNYKSPKEYSALLQWYSPFEASKFTS